MTLGNVTNTEDYYQLAAQEAALAKAAVTNESRAHHYADGCLLLALSGGEGQVGEVSGPGEADTLRQVTLIGPQSYVGTP